MKSLKTAIVGLFALVIAGIPGAGRAQQDADQRDVTFDVSGARDQVVFAATGAGLRDLYILDLATKVVTPAVQSPSYDIMPAFSPDGRQIVYASAGKVGTQVHIFIRSLISKVSKQLTSSPTMSDTSPTFSADGKRIVFDRATRSRPYAFGGTVWVDSDIYAMDADGSHCHAITHEKYQGLNVSAPGLTPDGKSIVFSADRVENEKVMSTLYIVAADGKTPPVKLTEDDRSSSPAISRDGKKVAYISDKADPFNFDIYVLDLASRTSRRVTSNKSYNAGPCWDSTGKNILFMSDKGRANRYELWEIGEEGSGLRRIAASDLFDKPLQWQPHEPSPTSARKP